MSTATPTISESNEPTARRIRRRDLRPLLRDVVVDVIGQRRTLQRGYQGIMHFMIFWGVTVQVLGTVLNLMQMQLFIPFVELTFPRGQAYLAYELLMDLAGGAILIGVLMALFRRLALRPAAVETGPGDYYALVLLGLIPLAGFALEGSRLLASAPTWANWSPIGNGVASLMRAAGVSVDTAVKLHPFLFWTHMILGLSLVASIPFTKLRHLLVTPLNILFKPRRQAGALSLIDDFEEAESFGVGKISEFSPQQLLSFDACVRCGRCQEACPVAVSGMPFSPRDMVRSLRQEMSESLMGSNGHEPRDLIGGSLPKEAAWYCTTCGDCLSHCPAFVNPVDAIIEMRRYQVLTTGTPPGPVAAVLRNLERQGNPWGMAGADRASWSQELGVRELAPGEETDVLLFLGCAFAFDDRGKQVFKAFTQLLDRAGIDYATLGLAEGCCGESARRMGEEYLYQMLAGQNIEALDQVKFNRIVTQCPHCFNTLKNEYPQLGGEYQVQHYADYLMEIMPQLNLGDTSKNGAGPRVTFHDPCYLGRYNQITESPRMLLQQAGVNRVEMKRQRQNSFCCGGGGGQMWMESDAETRINRRRLADALDVKADLVATACPYCLLMFDDAIRSQDLGEQVQVMDIAELLVGKLSAS